MSRGRRKETPLDQWCVLMDYGGHTVWMTEEKARALAKSFRRKKNWRLCYLVHRKSKETECQPN